MRAWYIPSWNGDLRLEPNEKDPEKTVLTIVSPTEGEKKILDAIQKEAVKQGWITDSVRAERSGFFWRKKKVVFDAPITRVGPIVATLMRPGAAVLTAITFTDGKMVTCSGGATDLVEALKPAEPEKPKTEEKSAEKPKEKPEPDKAATVKRPTPSCPQCEPGAIGPASEVLLSFLSEEQHDDWAKKRAIVVEGGLSGHRYLIAHRNTPLAAKFGRICYDLDNDVVVHFHDRTVPPEEEVLAAKLILEHREPWLRNEATMLGLHGAMVFKNPFGDGGDGVPDAMFTERFGEALGRALNKARRGD